MACVSPPHDPAKHLAKVTLREVETYGQSGDAERAMQRLCAAVKAYREGQGG